MFAAATSLFARTNISQNYILSAPGTPLPPPLNGLPAPPPQPPFTVGLWKVTTAAHKTTGKRVSVWTFEKRSAEMDRVSAQNRDRVLEVLKLEASALGRMRHPCILEMVEPLEDTRSELVFATEMLLSTLQLAIPNAGGHSAVELDEIEILKGILQLCKGLAFLHTSARLIHSNLTPTTVVINASGDWKISGLGLTVPLVGSDGAPSRWEYVQPDSRMPTYVQHSFDYLPPEYKPDGVVSAANDMYSLGCLIYAVNSKGSPPHKNHGNMNTLRENANKPIVGMESWDPDLRALVSSLVTPNMNSRPTPTTLPSYSAFSSLPISTLNFLDRANFASKTREEKIIFMKGLTGVLDRFSDGLKIRKILPSLLEEMKDPQLLPAILPGVFAISNSLSPNQFASTVLPSLKPLFVIKEPPQNMLTLLENLELLQGKTEKPVFKEHVLPLVYHALESEHAIVQERALTVVPGLCETIDYAEVQGVLFPRVALVFTKTKLLSVKVASLVCFKSMVKTLDQSSLTQKLVPLLSKIRTKEPTVMLATLDVQEAMGFKVDREAVATLVLPQLWAMSIGPLLNVTQFARFMQVIKSLGERVEREHMQFLKDSQRVEDRATGTSSINGGGFGAMQNGMASGGSATGTINFQSLVSGAGAASGVGNMGGVATPTSAAPSLPAKSWDDDVWGSILGDSTTTSRPTSPPPSFTPSQTQSLPTTPLPFQPATLPGHASRPSTSSRSAFAIPGPPTSSANKTLVGRALSPPAISPTLSPSLTPARPSSALATSSFTMGGMLSPSAPMTPMQPLSPSMTGGLPQKPNYNISMTPSSPMSSFGAMQPAAPSFGSMPLAMTPSAPAAAPMVPLVPSTNWSNQSASSRKQDFSDFDPLL